MMGNPRLLGTGSRTLVVPNTYQLIRDETRLNGDFGTAWFSRTICTYPHLEIDSIDVGITSVSCLVGRGLTGIATINGSPYTTSGDGSEYHWPSMTRGFKRKEFHYSIGICIQVGTRGIYGQSCFVPMSIWIIDNCLCRLN